ncbi:hypothetical protein [Streptomyces sp. NPDC005890]|uniref:hypothetical protein n=1 Tax=Streptomyces sp. NPDC005890 TaxID=3154568 RepID=UPI0033C6B570
MHHVEDHVVRRPLARRLSRSSPAPDETLLQPLGILPQFIDEQQATARLIAESHDAAVHLPSQILQGLT